MHAMTKIRSRSSVERYSWGELCSGWPLLESHDLRIVLESVPPGEGEVLHMHQRASQFFFVLSGRATMNLDGEVVALGAHEGCAVDPGVPHRIWNDGQADLEFLVVSAPTTIGDRVPIEVRGSSDARDV